MLIPRLAGRAQLRRQALKLQWWIRDERLFDMSVCSIPDVPMWELVVEEGYGFGDGFRVVFAVLEPDETIWVLSITRLDEQITEPTKQMFQARLNVVMERKEISHENPFGAT